MSVSGVVHTIEGAGRLFANYGRATLPLCLNLNIAVVIVIYKFRAAYDRESAFGARRMLQPRTAYSRGGGRQRFGRLTDDCRSGSRQ
jgi:hypothetical protein